MGRWCMYVLMPDLFGAHWALCTSPLQKATEKNVLFYFLRISAQADNTNDTVFFLGNVSMAGSLHSFF